MTASTLSLSEVPVEEVSTRSKPSATKEVNSGCERIVFTFTAAITDVQTRDHNATHNYALEEVSRFDTKSDLQAFITDVQSSTVTTRVIFKLSKDHNPIQASSSPTC